MELNSLTIMNFNASRTSNLGKIDNFLQFLGPYNPSVVNIQEINVKSALKMFSSHFQVIVNIEIEAKDSIGLVTLIKKRNSNFRYNYWKKWQNNWNQSNECTNMECIP